MQWLYDYWMKATPFLAVYSAILIWMYVKDVNYALFLIWMQTPIYWAHEFEEYICPIDRSLHPYQEQSIVHVLDIHPDQDC